MITGDRVRPYVKKRSFRRQTGDLSCRNPKPQPWLIDDSTFRALRARSRAGEHLREIAEVVVAKWTSHWRTDVRKSIVAMSSRSSAFCARSSRRSRITKFVIVEQPFDHRRTGQVNARELGSREHFRNSISEPTGFPPKARIRSTMRSISSSNCRY